MLPKHHLWEWIRYHQTPWCPCMVTAGGQLGLLLSEADQGLRLWLYPWILFAHSHACHVGLSLWTPKPWPFYTLFWLHLSSSGLCLNITSQVGLHWALSSIAILLKMLPGWFLWLLVFFFIAAFFFFFFLPTDPYILNSSVISVLANIQGPTT